MLADSRQQFRIEEWLAAEYDEEVYAHILRLAYHPVEYLRPHVILMPVASGVATLAAEVTSDRRGYQHGVGWSYAIFPHAILTNLWVTEQHAYHHACYVTSAYIGMDVSQYPAEELTPWFSPAEPVIGPVTDNTLLFTPGNVLNRLDNIRGLFIRAVT